MTTKKALESTVARIRKQNQFTMAFVLCGVYRLSEIFGDQSAQIFQQYNTYCEARRWKYNNFDEIYISEQHHERQRSVYLKKNHFSG